MEPENDGFRKEYPFPGTSFFRFHVKFQGCSRVAPLNLVGSLNVTH